MAWRVAKSLEVLRQQLNTAYPNRSKATDGTRASDEHRARSPNSDHNEAYINGEWVVRAMDITHDPNDGCDCQKLFDNLIASKDERIKYLIWNKQISNPTVQNWKKRPAANHEGHIHISVKDDPELFDDTTPWDFDGAPADVEREPVGPRFRDITTTVFGGPDDKLASGKGAYGILDHKKPQVALPYNFRTNKEPLPKVRLFYGDNSVIADVTDVGPWNTNDPYWKTNSRPGAESGKDQFGRKTNLAGIDITQAAADALGLPGTGIMRKAKIDWEFVDAKAPVTPPPIKPNPPTEPPDTPQPPPIVVTPPVVPPIVLPPPPFPGAGLDWGWVGRLVAVDWEAQEKRLERAEMEIKHARDVHRAIRSGMTAGQIAEARENKMPVVDTAPVTVDVVPFYRKRTFWLAAIAGASGLLGVITKNAFTLSPDTQSMLVDLALAISGLAGGGAVYTATTSSTVTPAGAAKARSV